MRKPQSDGYPALWLNLLANTRSLWLNLLANTRSLWLNLPANTRSLWLNLLANTRSVWLNLLANTRSVWLMFQIGSDQEKGKSDKVKDDIIFSPGAKVSGSMVTAGSWHDLKPSISST